MKFISKILLSILLGVSLAFLGAFLLLGSITAIITLGPILLPSIALGACIVTISVRFIIPALIKAFSKKVVESNIKDAIQENDPEKIKLQQWLTVAKKDDPNAIWQFQFLNGESLTEHAFNQSTFNYQLAKKSLKTREKLFINQRDRLNISQSYTRGITQAWQSKKKPVETIETTFYQRFISKLANLVDLKWNFNAKPDEFNDEKFLAQLKQHTENKNQTQPQESKPKANHPTQANESNVGMDLEKDTSIRERYIPNQLLESAAIIYNQMAKSLNKPQTEWVQEIPDKKLNTPAHLKHWLSNTSINHQIDQAHIQQQNTVEQQQQTINVITALKPDQNLNVEWKDDSALINYANIQREHDTEIEVSWIRRVTLENNGNYYSWITNIYNSLLALSLIDANNSRYDFKISTTALNKIKEANLKPDNYQDISALPLGFMLKIAPTKIEYMNSDGSIRATETRKICTLKYNEDYAIEQKKQLAHVELRDDPTIIRAKQKETCLYENIDLEKIIHVAFANNQLLQIMSVKNPNSSNINSEYSHIVNCTNTYYTDLNPTFVDELESHNISSTQLTVGGVKAVDIFTQRMDRIINEFNTNNKEKNLEVEKRSKGCSNKALNILNLANQQTALGWRERYFNYEALPLGLFLDSITTTAKYVHDERHLGNELFYYHEYGLNYSSQYREQQINNLGNLLQQLQPKFNNIVITDPKMYAPISFENLQLIISEKNFNLSSKQWSFIQRASNQLYYIDLLKALALLATISTPEHVVKFMDVIQKINSLGLTESHNYNNISILINSYMTYLSHTPDFNTDKPLQNLQQIHNLNKDQMDCLFSLLNSAHITQLPHFEEVTRGLFYFINFFKKNDLPFPSSKLLKNLLDSGMAGGNFAKLSGIMHCLISLKHSKPSQLVFLSLLDKMPSLVVIKAHLRAGYNFVHRDMQFDSSGNVQQSLENLLENTIIINPAEFKKITFKKITHKDFSKHPDSDSTRLKLLEHRHATLRAAYLRYLAVNVKPKSIKDALEKLERLTQNISFNVDMDYFAGYIDSNKLNNLEKTLETTWDNLLRYIEKLPQQFAAEEIPLTAEEINKSILPAADAQFKYEQDDIIELAKQLKLSDEETTKILLAANEANDLITQYHELTPEELHNRLAQARKNITEKKLTPIECLALLREAYYRFTLSKSKLQPPQGSWLRLEQFMVVLLAFNNPSQAFQVSTSEGKTLIIQLIALMNTLCNKNEDSSHKKVDVITHNESLATEGTNEIRFLASLTGCKIATKSSSQKDIIEADIYYTDIASEIIRAKHAKVYGQADRKPNIGIVDEDDNIAVDIHANTTMQISAGSIAAEKDLVEFLQQLNHRVRNKLAKLPNMLTKEEQLAYLQSKLKCNYANNMNKNVLEYWLRASVTAMDRVLGGHYTIEAKEKDPSSLQVKIVHEATTGRIDQHSQWGNGVHQCVAAWEKFKSSKKINEKLEIPGLSKVIAEGDIAHHLQSRYETIYALSGTQGASRVIEKILEILGIKNALKVMPRAKRPKPENAAWPKISKLTNEEMENSTLTIKEPIKNAIDQRTRKQYNRNYHFPPIIIDNRKDHINKLLETIMLANKNKQSTLVFFNTINECNEFYSYLKLVDSIGENQIQILDDVHDDENDNVIKLRPSEQTIIDNANNPGMITLTTAAGGRGLDFNDVTLGLITKPGLHRVISQEADRVGRNGKFGMTYEIYCAEDLGKYNPYQKDNHGNAIKVAIEEEPYKPKGSYCKNSQHHHIFINEFQENKQENDLLAIENRAPLRAVKQEIQEEYAKIRSNVAGQKQKDNLKNNWANFFSSCEDKPVEVITKEWNEFKAQFIHQI